MPGSALSCSSPPLGEEAPDHEPPYTTALLLRLSAALSDIAGHEAPLGLAHAAEAANILLTHGIALIEPARARMWIDERVYSGALFRLRLAEQPPSITLPPAPPPQDQLTARIALDLFPPPSCAPPLTPTPLVPPSDPSDIDAIPSFLDRRKAPSR